jgi:hypothetical protein
MRMKTGIHEGEERPVAYTQVHCRFDLNLGASLMQTRELLAVVLPAAPNVGELVNIEGTPYYVTHRAWAIATETDHERWAPGLLYCYCTVTQVLRPPYPGEDAR